MSGVIEIVQVGIAAIAITETQIVLQQVPEVQIVELTNSGPQGPPGPPGTPGINGGAAASYSYVQSTPSAVWTIVHGLGFYPAVTVIDTLGRVVEGEQAYPDVNTLVLTFSATFSGSAYVS